MHGGGASLQGLLSVVPGLAGDPFPVAIKVVAAPGVPGVLCQGYSPEALRGELSTQ